MDYKFYKKAELLEILQEKDNEIDDLQYELDRLNEAYCDLENSIDNPSSDNFDIKSALKDIIDDAENQDYGIVSYRRLNTKHDLINYIKKECLQ